MDQGGACAAAHTVCALVRPITAFSGFSVDEADLLTGDELSRAATWNGKSDLSQFTGRQVSARVQMSRAELFSVTL